MIRKNFFSFIVVSLFTCLSMTAYATTNNEITIVNHFNTPLAFKISVNPAILPDLPQQFTLPINGDIHTKVLDKNKEAYVQTKNILAGKSAFWGVDIREGKTTFHGYIDKGIAYSWDTQKIVFCTEEEFKTKHSCLS